MKDAQNSVLVVDDVAINRMTLRAILEPDYLTFEADSGKTALTLLDRAPFLPSVILLDIVMPEMDGFEVLRNLKRSAHTSGIPVIFITASNDVETETRGLRAGAVDYISKPFNPEVIKARVDNHVELKRYRDDLKQAVDEKVQQLILSKENMLETLATVIEYRNLESGEHVKRTSLLAKELLAALALSPRSASELSGLNTDILLKAIPTHDIGKVGIPDEILLKPGRLTDEEFGIMKTHSIIGSDIIDTLLSHDDDDEYLQHCRDICRHHHERFDGKGYPDGLKGRDIPFSARVMSIIDVYDALMSRRIYKQAYSRTETIKIMAEGMGTQFDPAMLDSFLGLDDTYLTRFFA